MEQVNKLLEQTAYVLLFCLAVSFLLLSSDRMGQSIKLLQNSVYQQNVIREQDLEDYKEEGQLLTATRAEVIGCLIGAQEADIKINGIIYIRDSFERESFDYSVLTEGIYRKEYVLGADSSDEGASNIDLSDTNSSEKNIFDKNTIMKEIIFTHQD